MFEKIDKYIERLIECSTPYAPMWNIESIRQGKKPHWNYIDGCMITSLLKISNISGEIKYFDFAEKFIDAYVQEDGTILGYDKSTYNLDDLNEDERASVRNQYWEYIDWAKEELSGGNEYFAMYAVPSEERCNLFLKDKKVAISSSYEKGRLKEMLYIIQLIVNHGGKYTFKGENADLFVKYSKDESGMVEWCPREEKVDEAIEKGKKIRKVNLDEFLYALGYDESEVEDNYLKAVERVKKIIRKEETKKEKKKQERAKSL